MKSIFIFGIPFLLLSCGQQADKNKTPLEESPVKDTTSEVAKIDPTAEIQTDETISPNQQELNKALANPAIDDYYKEVYRQEKLITADDSKMLSITGKLFTEESDKDLFFFIVFTKSMNGSDGAYSEAAGHSALKFVTERTEWFADYFNVAPKLNDQDLDNWAQYVYGEIQISRENEEKKAVEELERRLFENIRGARKEYEDVIGRFVKKIRRELP